jgi:hypothetical protein
MQFFLKYDLDNRFYLYFYKYINIIFKLQYNTAGISFFRLSIK